MMNPAMQMMENHKKDMPASGMDMAMMQECIEACSACEQACTTCAGMMTGMDMAMCANMCMNAADTSNAMMRMMMRPNGMHMDSFMAMLQATTAMASACADECMKHSDMSDDCRMCSEVCRQCAMEIQKMMDAMKGMMPVS